MIKLCRARSLPVHGGDAPGPKRLLGASLGSTGTKQQAMARSEYETCPIFSACAPARRRRMVDGGSSARLERMRFRNLAKVVARHEREDLDSRPIPAAASAVGRRQGCHAHGGKRLPRGISMSRSCGRFAAGLYWLRADGRGSSRTRPVAYGPLKCRPMSTACVGRPLLEGGRSTALSLAATAEHSVSETLKTQAYLAALRINHPLVARGLIAT